MVDLPLPWVKDVHYPPQDGTLQAVPSFCKSKDRDRCRKFYEEIRSAEGFHTCPYGFAAFRFNTGSSSITFTCLRVSGHVNKKQLSKRLGSDDVPVFQPSSVQRLATCLQDPDSLNARLATAQETVERTTRFIYSTIHEIRRLNGLIKAVSERLSRVLGNFRADSDLHKAQSAQTTIFQTSALVSIRLNAFDFQVNPTRITAEAPRPIPVHHKFHKIVQCLRVDARGRRANVRLQGICHTTVRGWDIFEMLPFVIVENAMKFAPDNENVDVWFEETPGHLEIRVRSVGPLLKTGEETIIAQEGYRGVNARSCSDGSGLGLTLAADICDLHNIRLTFCSGPEQYRLNGVPYAVFEVHLQFDPASLGRETQTIDSLFPP